MGKKLANVTKMTHDDWLQLRKKSIGGSDAAVCVGMNPWKDKLTLWADKMGYFDGEPDNDNERMRLGRDLEQYVADRFMEATGKKVRVDNFMYVHDDYDFLTANIDRTVVGENAALECKTMSEFGKYDLRAGDIPKQYYCQLQHYMAVMGYDKMYLAILQFGKGFYWYEVARNDDDIAMLLASEIEFWNNNVLTKIQPDADGSDSSFETLNKLHPHDNGLSIVLTESDDLIKNLLSVQEMKKRIEAQEKSIKAEICSKLGDCTEGSTEHYVVTWKSQSRQTVDSKALKEKYPDVYEAVCKTSETRVLKTKEVK